MLASGVISRVCGSGFEGPGSSGVIKGVRVHVPDRVSRSDMFAFASHVNLERLMKSCCECHFQASTRCLVHKPVSRFGV